MSSQYSLRLSDDWDLHVDPAGNIPTCVTDYSIAQNVANAFRLFTQDAWFFPERGIPHFLNSYLGKPVSSDPRSTSEWTCVLKLIPAPVFCPSV